MEALLHDELLSDTAWVQELHSPGRDGDQHEAGAAGFSHAEEPLPSGAVLSQRLRAMPRPTLPYGADDINPAPWRRTVTEWLPGSFMPAQAPDPAVAWPPRSNTQDPAGKPKTYDLRNLSQAKLLTAARQHNSSFNIIDPIGAVLDGVTENARLNDPSRASHPSTLGGNPIKDEYTRAWTMIMKNGPGPNPEEVRKVQVQVSKPARQVSVEPPARAASAPAAPVPAQAAAASASAPPPTALAPAPKVAYGTLTPEQQKFTQLLSSFLEVPVRLPLLAPGAQVLDLKRLYMEVSTLGGYNEACATNSWPQLASSLQNDSRLAGILRQVYAYYLLPVEEVMPGGIARHARLMEILEAKVREHDALPSLRSGVKLRPPYPKVKEAMTSCADALKRWATNPPAAAVKAAGKLQEQPGQAQNLQQGQQQRQQEGQQLQQQQPEQQQQQQQQESSRKQEQEQPSVAVAAAPALAMCLARHLARNVFRSAHENQPLLLHINRAPDLQQATGHTTSSTSAAAAMATGAGPASGWGTSHRPSTGQVLSGPQQPDVSTAAGSGQASGPAVEAVVTVQFTWKEVEPLAALITSLKQLRAGPAVMQQPAPRLKEHYLAQARPGGGTGDVNADLATSVVPVSTHTARRESTGWEDARAREDRLPTGKRRSVGFTTPKCGNCRTCNNPTLKKACETNRARLLEGQEPVFLTKEAELAYQVKKAKLEES